jgi:adenylate cyclase
MGIVYARMGDKTEARKIAEQYESASWSDPNEAYTAAILFFALGEKDRGLELLDKACDFRSRRLVFLKTSPYFETVRQEPRFLALLKKGGLSK